MPLYLIPPLPENNFESHFIETCLDQIQTAVNNPMPQQQQPQEMNEAVLQEKQPQESRQRHDCLRCAQMFALCVRYAIETCTKQSRIRGTFPKKLCSATFLKLSLLAKSKVLFCLLLLTPYTAYTKPPALDLDRSSPLQYLRRQTLRSRTLRLSAYRQRRIVASVQDHAAKQRQTVSSLHSLVDGTSSLISARKGAWFLS